MTQWQQHGLDARIRSILSETVPSHDHHLGRPFLTAYQIAIEFKKRHPDVVQNLGLQVGGAGIGEHTSLAQYIARELSQRIKNRTLDDIDGAFLSTRNVESLVFSPEVLSSTANLSMFRIAKA